MNFVFGRVAQFIRDPDGELKGLLLEGGREVRFPVELRESLSVAVEGVARTDDFPEGYLLATRVTNMDSQQSATLPALKHKGKPGMQLTNTPVDSASLAPLSSRFGEECDPVSPPELDDFSDSLEAKNIDGGRLHPPSFFRSMLRQTDASGMNFARNDSGRSIGQAYDSLHRIQAILAYLHIMKHSVPGISQFLDEAKHTYVQALARFSATDFLGAKEFAEASGSLSRIVEIVMARTLRSDSTLPSLVPPPPDHISVSPESVHVEEDLAHAESVLARIHWVLEHGTLPSEDRAQVRKIASWGDEAHYQLPTNHGHGVHYASGYSAHSSFLGARGGGFHGGGFHGGGFHGFGGFGSGGFHGGGAGGGGHR